MPLKSTNTLPPGGFLFTEKSTGFSVSKMMPFPYVVRELVAHRKLNNLPRATPDEAAYDIEEFNCLRLGNDAQYCIGGKKKVSHGTSPLESQSHQRSHARLVGLSDKVKALGAGASILRDWVGDGMLPVPRQLAQSRADACTGRLDGKPCKHNQPGSGVISGIAEAIRAQMEKKNEINSTVEGEGKLNSCAICLCHLPLKVHVPMATIIERTPDAMIQKFQEQAPAKCWMLTEK